MKEKETKELKLTKNIIIPFPNFQQNTIISPTQMNDNFEEIEHAYNELIDNHNGIVTKIQQILDSISSNSGDIVENENIRVESERTRSQSELERIENEKERQTNELNRISMYNIHLNDEIKREQKHIEMVQSFDDKIQEINDVIEDIPTPEELKGEKGDKGDKGDKGERGERGERGIQGMQGIQGIQGLKGEKGEKGEKGDKGEQGEQGIQGLKGEKGDKGDKGDTPDITPLEVSIEEALNKVDDVISQIGTKSENTEYTTVNGIKEFECKSGYVDNIIIEGQTLVNKFDKETWYDNGILGGFYTYPLEQGKSYKFIHCGYGDKISFFDENQGIILNGETLVANTGTAFNIALLSNSDDIEIDEDLIKQIVIVESTQTISKDISSFEGLKSVGQGGNIEVITRSNVNTQEDKKQIATTLRSLPNGVKDTIEKRGNKYVKVQRCEEYIVTGHEDTIECNGVLGDCMSFMISSLNVKSSYRKSAISDKFIHKHDVEDTEHFYLQNDWIVICLSKTKLSSPSDEGFKSWLQTNPVTIVYELETPIITELPNFNPQTFDGVTTLSINSGIIQAEANFEVTNDINSEIGVLKDKVSSLDYSVNNIQKIHYSTIEPTNYEGKDGDFWIIYEE